MNPEEEVDEMFKSIKKLEDMYVKNIQIEPDDVDLQEYKELFDKAKEKYPDEYDYIIHLACVSYLHEKNDKKM